MIVETFLDPNFDLQNCEDSVRQLDQFLKRSQQTSPKKKTRVAVFREKNRPVILSLEEALGAIGREIETVKEEIRMKHKYLSGLCRRPYTEKSVTFSKQSLQTSHLARIEKLKSHQRNDKRMRSQKQKTYIRLLEGLRKEQEYYLEVLKLEEKEQE